MAVFLSLGQYGQYGQYGDPKIVRDVSLSMRAGEVVRQERMGGFLDLRLSPLSRVAIQTGLQMNGYPYN